MPFRSKRLFRRVIALHCLRDDRASRVALREVLALRLDDARNVAGRHQRDAGYAE